MINESIRLNELGVSSELALETSGHGALKENYFGYGAYQIVILVKIATLHQTKAGTIDALIEPFRARRSPLKLDLK